MHKLQAAVLAAMLIPVCASAQSAAAKSAPQTVPAKMIVTLGHLFNPTTPLLHKEDLTITQDYEPLPITSMIPLRGDRGGLELFVLVDNCSSCEPGKNFEELRRFIGAQPSTTAIGVAYIQDGKLELGLSPTADHEQAIKALNSPSGSKPASPFGALAELIDRWRPQAPRRAVLMISNGLNPAAKQDFEDPSAEAAIDAAQRGGVTIFAIYHPSADYTSVDYSKIYLGQVQLAHVADETGGEAYFLGFEPLPSLAPFLSDIADHLANQYQVEFLTSPGEASGLQEFRVKSKIPNCDLMAPSKAWVPGRAAASQGRKELR